MLASDRHQSQAQCRLYQCRRPTSASSASAFCSKSGVLTVLRHSQHPRRHSTLHRNVFAFRPPTWRCPSYHPEIWPSPLLADLCLSNPPLALSFEAFLGDLQFSASVAGPFLLQADAWLLLSFLFRACDAFCEHSPLRV